MKFLITLALLFSLVGCSSLSQSPNGELLVTYATSKFISRSSSPSKRAERVIEIANSAISFLDKDKMPINQVETLILNKIDWSKLDASDRLLIEALITRVKSEIVNSNTLDQETVVSASKVLGWIVKGAKIAGA